MNGDMIAQGSQFSLRDVEVVVAQVDLDAVGYDLLLFKCLFVYVMHFVLYKLFLFMHSFFRNLLSGQSCDILQISIM